MIMYLSYRHPESHILTLPHWYVISLSLPDFKLPKWSEEGNVSDPEAATLGAGLEKALELYTDLQKAYSALSSNLD